MNIPVILTFALVVVIEIAIPLTLGYCLIRKFGLKWRVFLYGALFFIVSQVIHVPLLMVLEPPYSEWVRSAIPEPGMALALYALFLGLIAGLLEEGIRYGVFSRLFPMKKLALSRENGLLFGLGWGGIKSIIVALLVLQTLILYVVYITAGPEALLVDPAQAGAVEMLGSITPLDIIPGLLERILAITLHIAFTFLVLLSVIRSRPIFLVAAIAWHTVMDFLAVYISRTYGIWPTEGVLAVNAILALIVIFLVWHFLGRDIVADLREEVNYL